MRTGYNEQKCLALQVHYIQFSLYIKMKHEPSRDIQYRNHEAATTMLLSVAKNSPHCERGAAITQGCAHHGCLSS